MPARLLYAFRSFSGQNGGKDFFIIIGGIIFMSQITDNILIETTHLILRPFTESDFTVLSSKNTQPSWLRDVTKEPFDTKKPCVSLAVRLKSDNTVIGCVFVGPKPELDNELELGYFIADEYQNKGYATEAGKAMIWWTFEIAGRQMLSSAVRAGNKASRRVIEKLGFVYGGTRILSHGGANYEFDYFRLYCIVRFPGPEWDTMENLYKLYPLEPMGTFFDNRADGYNAIITEVYRYEKFGACFPKTDEAIQILDIGCGTGVELEYIWKQSPNAHITCLDLSRGMLDLLLKNHPDDHERITVVEASYLDWVYPKEAFDVVTSHATMHHFYPEEKAEIYRKILGAIKPGGLYIEGDFILDDAIYAEQYRRRHDAITEGLSEKAKAYGEYHVDLPLTLDIQIQLLQEAGFGSVEVLEKDFRIHGSRAILKSVKF
jgi:tRNA (cmo5U34)-methyltransferase